MRLLSKSERTIIVKAGGVLQGSVKPIQDEISSSRDYIAPGTTVVVTEECGKMLLERYGKEFMVLDIAPAQLAPLPQSTFSQQVIEEVKEEKIKKSKKGK